MTPLARLCGCLFLIFFSLKGLAQNCPTVQATATPICGTNTVQLNADTGFTTYSWSPSTGLSNPNIINPVASSAGSYAVTTTVNGPNLVINPNFAAGNTGFISGQTYTTTYSPCNYYVGSQWFATFFPGLQDHTPTADNMFMMIDGCTTPRVIWEEGAFAITPGVNYQFSFWATEAGATQPSYQIHFIGNVTGDVIVATITGIPAPTNTTWAWDPYGVPVWNSGANTSVTIRIKNMQTNGYGNDFGMDDFDFHRLCISTDTVQVALPLPPVNLGPDRSLCDSASFTLNAGPGSSYLWNTGDTTQSIVAATTGQYSVTVMDGPCSSSDTVQITTDSLVHLGPDVFSCFAAPISLNATNVPGSYLWSTGDTTQSVITTSTGTYWVSVANGLCSSADTVQVTFYTPVNLGPDVSVCAQPVDTLDAGTADTYLWSTGDTTQTIIVSATGTYWVAVTTGSCSSSDTMQFYLDPPVNLGPDRSLCDSASFTLNAGMGTAYLWSTGDTTQTIVAGTAGTYWIVLTNGACISSDTVQILVDPPIHLGPDTSVCSPPVALNLTATGNFLWSTGDTTQSIVATSTGTYWVTVTNGLCNSSDTMQIQLYANVNLGPDINYCTSPINTLDAGLADSYLWSTGDTTQTIITSSAGTYWVTITHSTCSSTDTVHILADPPANLGLDRSLCDSASFTLNAGPGTAYLWSTGDTTQTIVAGSAGTYWVTVTNGVCSSSDTVQIDVDPPVNLGPDTTVCSPPVALNLMATGNFLWSTGDTTQSIVATSTGTYWVTVTNGLCISSDTMQIQLYAAVNLGPDISYCTSPINTLNAGLADSYLWSTGDTTQTIITSSAGTYWVTVTHSTCSSTDTVHILADPPVNLGPDVSLCSTASPTLTTTLLGNYLWSTGDTTQSISPTSAGTYWVTVTNGVCVSTDTIQLTAVQTVSIGPDVAVCAGITVPLSAGISGSYLWNTGDTTQTIFANTSGQYWVTVTNNSCVSADTMQLTVYQPVNLGPDISICANPSTTLDAGPADSYLWSTGDITQTIVVNAVGTYWVTVHSGDCVFTDTITMVMDQLVNLGPDISLCNTFSVTLNAGTAASYYWSTGSTSQTIEPQEPGEYWVFVSTNNCTSSDTIELTGMPGESVLYIPNSFTPNHDGFNERFLAYCPNVVTFHMQIFNRWGELIFETSDILQGWDGIYKGKLVQEDTYVYVIDYSTDCGILSEQRRIGNVNVIR